MTTLVRGQSALPESVGLVTNALREKCHRRRSRRGQGRQRRHRAKALASPQLESATPFNRRSFPSAGDELTGLENRRTLFSVPPEPRRRSLASSWPAATRTPARSSWNDLSCRRFCGCSNRKPIGQEQSQDWILKRIRKLKSPLRRRWNLPHPSRPRFLLVRQGTRNDDTPGACIDPGDLRRHLLTGCNGCGCGSHQAVFIEMVQALQTPGAAIDTFFRTGGRTRPSERNVREKR